MTAVGALYPDDAAEIAGAEQRRRSDPLRRCIVTGAVRPRAELVRFAVSPEGWVVPDVEARLPGRGLWLTPESAVFQRALARNAFARAARRSLHAPADLAVQTANLLEGRCLALLGLARRAGHLVCGFDQVAGALRQGRFGSNLRPALLLSAADGAADGRGRLEALATGLPVVSLFSASALGAALGREHIVHALVAAGGFADGLFVESRRLAGLITPPPGRSPPASVRSTSEPPNTQ